MSRNRVPLAPHAIVRVFFAIAAASASGAQTTPPAPRETVARLEICAPDHSPFMLHATLPVPKGLFPRTIGTTPICIESHSEPRVLVPMQFETVSRYPTGEADVIEVIAPVELGKDERPGSRVVYDLIWESRSLDKEGTYPGREYPGLIGFWSPGEEHPVPSMRFGLRARDVYGNLYWASINVDSDASFGSYRVLKDGPYERLRRLDCTLAPRPSPGAQGAPLPHLMGVHAYLTEYAGEDVVRLDLRIHNGSIAGNREAHEFEKTLGIIYWKSLELVVPLEWICLPEVKDPFFGEAYLEDQSRVIPIVKPYPDGKLHMMGPQAQFERRVCLARGGGRAHAKEEIDHCGLAFCMRAGRWSWFDPATARYFADRDLIASVDFYARGEHHGKAAVRARLLGDLSLLRSGLESGTPRGYYVTASVMGWAHPWFVKEQGGVGGEGIATCEGYYAAASASREGYSYLELLHRMNVCRQPQAAFDGAGDIVGYHAWLGKVGQIPFDFRTNGGIVMPAFLLPCKRGPPASDQVRYVVEHGLRPPYDKGTPFEADGKVIDSPDNLLAWWPHDDQHLVRYMKNAKALVWLGNDAMAKDDLLLSADMYHLMRHESPHVAADWSAGVTLAVWEKTVAEHPHQGLWFGREDAWGIDAMCAAYSTASEEWRAKNRSWFDRMSNLLLDGAMPSGLMQRFVNERLLGDTRYAVTQTFECFFLIHALRCLNESVFRGVDDPRRKELEALAVRGVDYLMWGPPWARVANDWQPDPAHPTIFLQGPRQGIAIGLNDNYATPPFCDASRWGGGYLPKDGLGGGVEIFHPWAALSYAAECTQESAGKGLDNRYLRRTLDCWTPHASWKSLALDLHRQASDPSLDNSMNWIGLLGKLQSLGVR